MTFKNVNDTVKYYFGRLNLVYAQKVTKSDLILHSLISDTKFERRAFRWGFFEVTKEYFKDYEFICGYLVKYQVEGKEDIVDESNKRLEETNINMKRKGQCLFAINPKTGIIIHNIYGQTISLNQFNNVFCELLMEANDRLFINAEITAVTDEFEIDKIIQEFDNINKLRFKLHPSNPHNRDVWKKTDEKIIKIGAEHYLEEYSVSSNSNKGLTISKNSEAYSNIIMAIDGYGVAYFTGEKDGKYKTKSTSKSPITVFASKSNKIQMLSDTFDTFKSIVERFKSD